MKKLIMGIAAVCICGAFTATFAGPTLAQCQEAQAKCKDVNGPKCKKARAACPKLNVQIPAAS